LNSIELKSIQEIVTVLSVPNDVYMLLIVLCLLQQNASPVDRFR